MKVEGEMISQENLDKRICDCEEVQNTQTYREFIRESEKEFELEEQNLDKISDKNLNAYFEFLCYLWEK